jgi:hypothetical protein
LHHIHPPTSFPTPCPSPSGRPCSALLFSDFVEGKTENIIREIIVFLLVEIKIATQGDSLCCFHAHVYYNPTWFISTRPLHYSLVPFP